MVSGLKQQIEKLLILHQVSDVTIKKVLGLVADYVCISKEELTELFDNRPSSCCDVHHAEPMEYENWICMLREKLLGEKKK